MAVIPGDADVDAVTECTNAPHGYDVYTHTEVVPKAPPYRWVIGVVTSKSESLTPGAPGTPATGSETVIMQLTADQQVELSISGVDRYGNPVDIEAGTVWRSSDESIVQVFAHDASNATAVAVGPIGTAAVTVSADTSGDETPEFVGSLAIDVVAGDVADIEITAGEPEDKPVVEPRER